MAISPAKTWLAGDVLFAADLNAEFLNIYNNGPASLGSPRTAAFDLNAQSLILDAAGNATLTADTADQVDLQIGGSDILVVTPMNITFNGLELLTEASFAAVDVSVQRASQIVGRVAEIESNVVLSSQIFD